ncbi:FHIP family protein AGAP011705 isoform X1 [Diorhabda carinulata]|uniref:FHIP family protein AGAP011705 isoform X1 n=1 Tax=Diorhabda carinulata TaxID=1163345 RepID=UPI0025A05904|nr:FHIP family protein AGAP011705 isoform X1 [Diorhabda carinulata]
MEWINSFLSSKSSKSIINPEDECDPQACYDSFKEHWHQVCKLFNRVQQLPSHDDVLGVVNHLEQMATLLLYDIRRIDRLYMNQCSSQCLEYLFDEHILDKLYEWSTRSGRYINAIRCEQLKLYKMLVTHSRHILLLHETFVNPLIKLLCSMEEEVFSNEVENLLVDLINQLSALLMQNVEFIDLFFQEVKKVQSFIIFSLLIPFVHREDSIGMKARDALLLCMSLSKKNKRVAVYVADDSNFSILLITGLGGLYSALPNVLEDILVPDWHRFTPDDVNEIKGLLSFVTSLEFSNAVAQVAHPLIRKQLEELLFRGFLIPVLGPALLQIDIYEQVAATAYLDLILRTLTNTGLLHAMLQFLLEVDFDGDKLLDILVQRLRSENRQLCLVSIAMFESIVDLNCEDLMLELVFKHLQPCLHLMLSQRKMFLSFDPYCQSFEKFLTLTPKCCQIVEFTSHDNGQWYSLKNKQSLYGKYFAYLCDARNRIAQCQMACIAWNNLYTGEDYCDNSAGTSLERSSGYESLNCSSEDTKTEEYWEKSSNYQHKKQLLETPKITCIEQSGASAGPFLSILMEKLRNYLSNSFYINIHLTGLISRLAAYPQPVLRAYLLDHSLILQPNVPSIFEVIGILKQQIDDYLYQRSNCLQLIKFARDLLVDRELMLVNQRKHNIEQHNKKLEIEPFQRNISKRRSLGISPISSIFGRRPSQVDITIPVMLSDEVQFNNIYQKFNASQHVALCAVLLSEWLKELSALAQEHTVAHFANLLK